MNDRHSLVLKIITLLTLTAKICSIVGKERYNLKFVSSKRMFTKAVLMCSIAVFLTGTGCSGVNSQSPSSSESGATSEVGFNKSSNTNSEDMVLTLALTGNPDIQDVIDTFNAADNGYQIVVKRYRENVGSNGLPITYTDEESQYADLEILQDIINTDDIDIICSESFFDGTYYALLEGKGAFADLYPFMEQDEEVNPSTLNQHILHLNETNGKLCSLPTFYGATTLIGESRYVGTKENWTIDDFMSYWNQMPDGSTINNSRQCEEVYYTLLRGNLSSFVDYENARVNFDSPEFKRILEFCGAFDSNHNEKGIYDYDAPEFVFPFYMDGFMSAAGVYYGDEPYTLVGYPSSDGEGAFLSARAVSYSISAKSSPEKQMGAWQFIRTFVTYEYQLSHDIMLIDPDDSDCKEYNAELGFPLNNKAFDEIAQGIITGKYYGGTFQDKGETYNIILPTQQDYQNICAYLNGIDRWEATGDGALWNIINEEVNAYFSGERSIDDTVNVIQSRASLWIAEQS